MALRVTAIFFFFLKLGCYIEWTYSGHILHFEMYALLEQNNCAHCNGNATLMAPKENCLINQELDRIPSIREDTFLL